MTKVSRAEYIWLDGAQPMQQLRSKTRVVPVEEGVMPGPEDFPEWGYDGSSTYQASGGDSDMILKPCRVVDDPIRGPDNYLVLCEVFGPNHEPHKTNSRATLRQILDAGGEAHEPWVGFEQEYTLFAGHRPLGWPDNGYPQPQGPFYCGVGSKVTFGRDLVEDHLDACIAAGLCIFGINAEVMPGQWEFQIGYRGCDEALDALLLCDHMQLARWLLCRLGEDCGVSVSYENKPIKGDWNGAGCHTNFSTKETRDPKTGWQSILDAIGRLKETHAQHIAVYGHGLCERLTGLHETCSIDEFRSGVSDRGSSIRIPAQVAERGFGYFEDRRPGANCDPYMVTARLIETVCGIKVETAARAVRIQPANV